MKIPSGYERLVKNILMLAAAGLFLSGCATNRYQKYYIDNTKGRDILSSAFLVPALKEPKLVHGNNQNEDTQKMLEDGYFMIGYSHFNASQVSDSEAIKFARAIHAADVLVYSHYTNTVTEMMPVTTSEIKTIDTVQHYGSEHRHKAAGSPKSTTVTITEFDTKYIPFNVDRYDYVATFWVKTRPPILGICPRELSADDRKKIGSNKGVIVLAVVNRSKAFMADIFKGDILVKIDSQEIWGIEDYIQTIKSLQGKEVTLTIVRDGQTLTKQVQLDSRING